MKADLKSSYESDQGFPFTAALRPHLVAGDDVQPGDNVEMFVPGDIKMVDEVKAYIEAYMRKQYA